MPTVLITGANRGLGLEFARQYAADGWTVIATARSASPELSATGARIEAVDMLDPQAVEAFGRDFDESLHLLIANAGVYGPATVRSADDVDAWLDVFRVNSVAPVLLAQALLPRLTEARGKAIALSSRMGSIADSSTGSIAYRSAKAALNMAWHVLAAETKDSGVTFALFNPGWVKTDMGGAAAPLSPPDSVAAMRGVIERLGPEQSGGFFHHDGSQIPW